MAEYDAKNPLTSAGEGGPRSGSGEGRDISGEGAPLSRPSLTRGPPSPAEGGGVGVAFILTIIALATPALADDKAECTAGITMIQSEIAKAPPEPVLAKLRKALKVAEREQKEGEFDECLDAVGDARRALK